MLVLYRAVVSALKLHGWAKDVKRLGWTNGSHFISANELAGANDRKLAEIYKMVNTVPVGTPPIAPNLRAGSTRPWSLYEKLAMRLGMNPGESFGLGAVYMVESPNLVHVFVVQGDNSIIFTDDKNLFPSDTMVAKFRLFSEASK